jgi:acyl-coenzyme A thioesterase PaaI-like protein
MNTAAIAEGMLNLVPFARTLGLSIVDVGVDDDGAVRAVAELPDAESIHNHVGGPHAGAMFSLGESASGAVVMAAFGDHMHRGVPLAVRADIAYRKVAMGLVRATARLRRPVSEVLAELDAGTRPEFAVAIEITTPDCTVTAEMTVVWTIRPHR